MTETLKASVFSFIMVNVVNKCGLRVISILQKYYFSCVTTRKRGRAQLTNYVIITYFFVIFWLQTNVTKK